jgi:tRNA pseudouridine55 synthase
LEKLSQKEPPLSGIFNIAKPAGMTSHDVVKEIRPASGERRVGHAGTLDPMATGVLLVCVGAATRVTEYLMNHDKCYRAGITLGVSTDTHDAEGEITHTADASQVTRLQVETALEHFVGTIEQVPPMYSALKQDGRRLYELAREGISVEREPRPVEIRDLAIVAWDPPRVTLDVICSKGTYMRAIARDLGDILGLGAHLSRLTRTASGHFTIRNACDLDTVVEALTEAWWMLLIHPLDEALLDYQAIIVDQATAERIRHGQMIEGPQPTDVPFARAYSDDGQFLAVMKYEAWAGKWQPSKVFAAAG